MFRKTGSVAKWAHSVGPQQNGTAFMNNSAKQFLFTASYVAAVTIINFVLRVKCDYRFRERSLHLMIAAVTANKINMKKLHFALVLA